MNASTASQEAQVRNRKFTIKYEKIFKAICAICYLNERAAQICAIKFNCYHYFFSTDQYVINI